MATVFHRLAKQVEQNKCKDNSNIIRVNHKRKILNHTPTTNSIISSRNKKKGVVVHSDENTLDESNRKVYVYDNKVRLEQVVKQCPGLYQLTHFCIYYYFALI